MSQSIDIADLCQSVDDDVKAYVVSTRKADSEVVIEIELDDQHEVGQRRKYEILTEGLVEATACPTWLGSLSYVDDHPVLWDYNRSWQQLYFSTAPLNPAEITGLLYETNERVFQGWRPLSRYINTFALLKSVANGLLADGPENLIAEYVTAIRHLLKLNTVLSQRKLQPLKALLLADYFVVCSEVTVKELPVTRTNA